MSTLRSLPIALVAEGQRMASICNACRYCEGYCAVFPSIERRLSFAESDLAYLANLCHNCGSCYYACQYAPPHEFNLNLPRLLADVRIETYKKYAWPGPLARLFEHGCVVASLVLVACMALLLLALMLLNDPSALMADGLSTLLLILGPERGWDYAEKHGIGAFFVMRTDTGFVTRSSQAFARLSGEKTE